MRVVRLRSRTGTYVIADALGFWAIRGADDRVTFFFYFVFSISIYFTSILFFFFFFGKQNDSRHLMDYLPGAH